MARLSCDWQGATAAGPQDKPSQAPLSRPNMVKKQKKNNAELKSPQTNSWRHAGFKAEVRNLLLSE